MMLSYLDAPTRHLLFTGKGGVGKTSLACASAVRLAEDGHDVLLVSTDPASNLKEVLEAPVGASVQRVDSVPNLSAVNIDPEAAADAYRQRVLTPMMGVLPEETVSHVEEQLSGIELIVGSKVDYQFGPVILLGMGGTSVEIYGDTTLRMAPLDEDDPPRMVEALKAHPLLEGYRGASPVDLAALGRLLMALSDLGLEIESVIDSIDLNPVICFEDKCMVADARIVLNRERKKNASNSHPPSKEQPRP